MKHQTYCVELEFCCFGRLNCKTFRHFWSLISLIVGAYPPLNIHQVGFLNSCYRLKGLHSVHIMKVNHTLITLTLQLRMRKTHTTSLEIKTFAPLGRSDMQRVLRIGRWRLNVCLEDVLIGLIAFQRTSRSHYHQDRKISCDLSETNNPKILLISVCSF